MTTPSPQVQLKAAAARRTVKDLRAQGAAQTVVANATETTQKQQEFANIAENTFYKVMFDGALDQEQKKAAFEAALTYDVNKSEADNKERMAEFVEFSAYLQEIRKKMALELIGLTETEAFADLKNVFETIGKEFIEFEKLLAPLTEGLEAINTLRMEDKAVEAVTEIHNSRQAQEDAKAAQAAAVAAAQQEKLALEQAIAATRLKLAKRKSKKVDSLALVARLMKLQLMQAT